MISRKDCRRPLSGQVLGAVVGAVLAFAVGAQEPEDVDIETEVERIRDELDATRRDAEAAAEREAEATARIAEIEAALRELETAEAEERTRAERAREAVTTATRPEAAEPGEVKALDGAELTVRTRSNVRAGPGLQHPVIATLDGGVPVTAHGELGEWTRITVGAERGWIYSRLLQTPD